MASRIKNTKQKTPRSRFIDEKRAAELIGFSRKFLQRHRSQETGPTFYKVGRHVRYRVGELLDWVSDHKVGDE